MTLMIGIFLSISFEVNTYTRAAQMEGLAAESSFRLSRVGGNILGMLQ